MLDTYSGATCVIFIVGDPIAQVKAPAFATRTLRARGADAVEVPAHVRPADLAAFLDVAARMSNVDGVIAAVPHKFAIAPLCHAVSARAASIGAVNIVRRDAQGRWFGHRACVGRCRCARAVGARHRCRKARHASQQALAVQRDAAAGRNGQSARLRPRDQRDPDGHVAVRRPAGRYLASRSVSLRRRRGHGARSDVAHRHRASAAVPR